MHKSGKASLTLNPLARPTSPIQALAVEFQDYLHFPDPAPLYAVMGTIAANMLPGNPVWLMLVGSASCGGTTLLETLIDIPGVHSISDLTGPSVFLSGVGKRDRIEGSTGGLLRQVGEHGAVVIKDFTSIMSMSDVAIKNTMGVLRSVSDGKYERPLGTDGGQVITWEGKLAVLTKSTPAVDSYLEDNASFGARWIIYRYPYSDGHMETLTSLDRREDIGPRKHIRALVAAFFDNLDLAWGMQDKLSKRKFSVSEKIRLAALGSFAARGRSTIRRNKYDREVESLAQLESPTRLSNSMGQIFLGMEVIGVSTSECWRVVQKIANDCVPQIRVRALEIAREHELVGVPVTEDVMVNELQVGRGTVRKVLGDLTILGMLEGREKDGTTKSGGTAERNRTWVLSRWVEDVWSKAAGKGL